MQRMTALEYWQPMDRKFPLIVHDFKIWLDEYANRIAWTFLFNAGRDLNYGRTPGDSLTIHDPKFQDLPQAMQIGIFIQYTVENGGTFFSDACPDLHSMTVIIDGITSWFQMEDELSRKLQNLA